MRYLICIFVSFVLMFVAPRLGVRHAHGHGAYLCCLLGDT